jgi:hypothetical protein
MRDRLAELTRQLRQGGQRPGGAPPQDGSGRAGEPTGESQGQGQGSAASPNGEAPSRAPGREARAGSTPAGGAGGGTADGAPGAEEVTRELRALERLAEGLGAEGDDLRRSLQSLQGYAPSLSAPGTEAWKQDFTRWETLRREIAATLEKLEARVSSKLQDQEHEDRLDAGASESAPDAYRRELARYYRSLARKPPS